MSGPYATLYTTAIDMWSFGCLCLNIWIDKTGELKQREKLTLVVTNSSHMFSETVGKDN